jgi:hypothetical protein
MVPRGARGLRHSRRAPRRQSNVHHVWTSIFAGLSHKPKKAKKDINGAPGSSGSATQPPCPATTKHSLDSTLHIGTSRFLVKVL